MYFQHLVTIQIFTIHFYIPVLQSKEQKVSPITTFSKKNDILSILNLAKKENLTVVCTKKDYIKVPEEFKNKITPVNLNLKIEKKNKFEQRVLECLRAN